jgi:hypothetical protein
LNTSFNFIEKFKNSEEIFLKKFSTDSIAIIEQNNKYVLSRNSTAQVYLLQPNFNEVNNDEATVIKEEVELAMVEEQPQQSNQPDEFVILPVRKNKRKEKVQSKLANESAECEINEKNIVCRTCGIHFKTLNLLNRHIRRHLKNGDFIPNEPYQDHYLAVLPNRGYSFECRNCRMCFSTRSYFQNHADKFHKDVDIKELEVKNSFEDKELKYECRTCKKKFNRADWFNIHIRFHLEKGDLVVTNDFSSGQSKPNGGAGYECPHCGMCFHLQHAYDTHMKQFHLDQSKSPNDDVKTELKDTRIVCRTCGLEYRELCSLNSHIKKHLENGDFLPNEPYLDQSSSPIKGYRYECRNCRKCFFSRFSFERHTVKHHKGEDIKDLQAKISTVDELLKKENVSEEPKFVCRTCLKGFGEKSSLNVHIKVHLAKGDDLVVSNESEPYNNGDTYECAYCGVVFYKKFIFMRHIKHCCQKLKTSNERFLMCAHCDQRFSKKHVLSKHILRSHMNKEQRYVCRTCNIEISTRSSYNKHLKLHMDKGDLIIPSESNLGQSKFSNECPHCGMVYNERAGLQVHFKKYHKNRCFVCAHCNDLFAFRISIKNHILNFHLNPNPKYRNKTVEKKFFDADGNPLVFICPCCKSQNASKHGMRIHILKKHIDEFENENNTKQYTCRICYRQFLDSVSLKNHIEKHLISKIPPRNCSYPNCGKQFFDESRLLGHVFKFHQNMSCTICNKRFKRFAYYKLHMKAIHEKNRVRAHLCPICGNRYVLTHCC